MLPNYLFQTDSVDSSSNQAAVLNIQPDDSDVEILEVAPPCDRPRVKQADLSSCGFFPVAGPSGANQSPAGTLSRMAHNRHGVKIANTASPFPYMCYSMGSFHYNGKSCHNFPYKVHFFF